MAHRRHGGQGRVWEGGVGERGVREGGVGEGRGVFLFVVMVEVPVDEATCSEGFHFFFFF